MGGIALSPTESVLLAELRAIRNELADVSAVVLGPKSGRRFVSGAQAARLLGKSYPTFKRNFVDAGRISPAKGNRYELGAVRRLKAQLEER